MVEFSSRPLSELSLSEAADEYVKTIYSQPDGWGRHVHPHYGVSHRIMIHMAELYGTVPSQEAISNSLKKYKFNQLSKERSIRHGGQS